MINGGCASASIKRAINDGSREPKIDITPYIKVSLTPFEIAEKMADSLLYCEIMMFFKHLLKTLDKNGKSTWGPGASGLEDMLYEELRARRVGRTLLEDEDNTK